MKSQSGFPHKDTSWLFGLIAVRAPLAKVKALATKKAKGLTSESHGFQMQDSDYSVLSWQKCEPELSKWLSKKLKTTVAYLWGEDTSGWFGYSVFKNGDEVEVYQFGTNYAEDLGEFEEESADSNPTLQKRQKDWDIYVTQDGMDFQFRSKLVKPAKEDLPTGLTFVDRRFKSLEISIPRKFPKSQEVISWSSTS